MNSLALVWICLPAGYTCREVKNGIVMRLMSSLVSDSVIQSGRLSFLRTGHSHEDIDQLFGQLAAYVRNNIRVALTSSDFITGLEHFCKSVDRPYEPVRFVKKLDHTRDW